jgi:hypothetical protein
MSNGMEITCPFCDKPTPKPSDILARTTECVACGRVISLRMGMFRSSHHSYGADLGALAIFAVVFASAAAWALKSKDRL